MNLKGKVRTESKVMPGVWLTVKILNKVQHAKRELGILEQRAKYTRAIQDREALVNRMCATVKREAFTGEDAESRYEKARDEAFLAGPAGDRERAIALRAEYEAIGDAVLLPAIIKAALVQIEAFHVGPEAIITVEQFLENAPDALLDEALTMCNEASGLTVDQQKN